MNYIPDTCQLYTHDMFINRSVFGNASNGTVSLSMAGTINTLVLSSHMHMHSNYLKKNQNIDITGYKIISNLKDLLYSIMPKLL